MPDGAGSWYVGGEFTSVGGHPRNNLAHLKADKSLDFTWDPNFNVNALTVAPSTSGVSSGTIYAGGNFTSIGGQNRNFIAELDASSGNATSWNPDANDMVWSLAVAPPISGVAPGSPIYAAGRFVAIGGLPRSYIAALDAGTGSATAWNPNALGLVNALVVAPPISGGSSSTIYVGGSFTSIGGRSNSYLGALRDGARTCQSAASGGSWRVSNWSNCGGAIPGDGDSLSLQAGHTLTLYGSLAANTLTTSAGSELNLPLGSHVSVEGTLTNNGRLTQTLAVPTSATTTFLNIKNATARFYYSFAELNGQSFNLLKLWRLNSGRLQIGAPYGYSETCGTGQLNCWLQAQNVSAYSTFILGSQFHVVTFVPLVRK